MVRGSYVESQGIRYTDQFLDLDGRIKKSEKEAQLPKDAIPVDFDPDTRIISAPTPHENHEELRTAPPTSWQEFVSQLPDWDADLLENTEGDDQSPVSNLKDVLQTSKTILLVSGGGVRSTSVGSFGWVVATSFTKLWSGMGKARGYPMTSNRAEAYGRLAGLLFLKRYTEFISISCPTNTLVSWCDNKQIVKWCDMEQDPYHSGC